MTIQDDINQHKEAIERLKGQQHRCRHVWGDVEYDPRVTGGYHTKPMHWHPGRPCADVWIDRTDHPRWKRTCKTCGLVQDTEQTKEVPCRGTLPGTTATEKVPTFKES